MFHYPRTRSPSPLAHDTTDDSTSVASSVDNNHRTPLMTYPDNTIPMARGGSGGGGEQDLHGSPCGGALTAQRSRPGSADTPTAAAVSKSTSAAPRAKATTTAAVAGIGGRYRHDPYSSEPSSPSSMASAPLPFVAVPAVSGGDGRRGGGGGGGWLPSSSASSLNVSLDAPSVNSPATMSLSVDPYAALGGRGPHYLPPQGTHPHHLPPHAAPPFGALGGYTSAASTPASASLPLPQGEPSALQLEAHFADMLGTMAAQATSSQGRHILGAILRHGHPAHVARVLEELTPTLPVLALDPHGCHVVRHLIESLSSEEELTTFVSYLTPEAVVRMASQSQYTRRALQALFETHRSTVLDDVVAVLASQVYELSGTQQGCIAIMRCLEYGAPHQRAMLVAALSRGGSGGTGAPHLLSMDPYGNYVMQAILRGADGPTLHALVERHYLGHLVPLAKDKFASNVVETLIRALDSCLTVVGVAPPRIGATPTAAAAACAGVRSRARGGAGGYSTPSSASEDERVVTVGRGVGGFSRGGGVAAPMALSTASSPPQSPLAHSPLARAMIALRRRIVAELGAPPSVGALVFDGYGNFVLQGLLDTCLSGCEFSALVALVRPILHASPFGHKIESKVRVCSRRWS